MPEKFTPYTSEQRFSDVLRAPEANELLERTPAWLTRWGSLSLILIIAIILSVGFFVRYPDTLEGQAIISTDPLPIKLKAQSSGRLARLLSREGTGLQEGAAIAEIENATGWDNILLLERISDGLRSAIAGGNDSLPEALISIPNQSFGEAQMVYNQLIQQLSARSLLRKEALYEKRHQNLQTQLGNIGQISRISKEEREMSEQQLAQARERFRAYEQLYRDKVISKQEYFDEAAKLRAAQMQVEQQKRGSVQNKVSANDQQKQLLELQYERSDKERTIHLAIEEALRNLSNYIQSWKQKYLLRAPYSGKLQVLKPLQVNQTISAGEELFVVIPEVKRYAALILVPATGIGKVFPGQKVHLLLDNYPYNEYGFLEGVVQKRSELPEPPQAGAASAQQSSAPIYRVFVSLPDTLQTTYRKIIPFSPEMSATGRIITKDRSLIHRLLSGIAKINK